MGIIQPGFDAPRPEHALRLPIMGIVGGIALAIVAKMVVPDLPVDNGHSLNELHGYCTGVVGLLVRGFGGASANAGCNNVGNWLLTCNIAAIAGLALAAWSGYVLYRRRLPRQDHPGTHRMT